MWTRFKSLQYFMKLPTNLIISCRCVCKCEPASDEVFNLQHLSSFSVHEVHRRRSRSHLRPGPQNRTSGSGEFENMFRYSLPPLCLSVRVTECNPVEAQIDPALGNRAAQTSGQLCAEKSGTCR